jgi:membrane associated rhomboid family serine protease
MRCYLGAIALILALDWCRGVTSTGTRSGGILFRGGSSYRDERKGRGQPPPRNPRGAYGGAPRDRPPPRSSRDSGRGYDAAPSRSSRPPPRMQSAAPSEKQGHGDGMTYALVLTTMLIWLGERAGFNIFSEGLRLHHASPKWWQPASSLFCHESHEHLMSNSFLLLVFGGVVERELGHLGLLLSFLFCGVVSNVISWVLLPKNTISAGASGSIFGLFSISVLSKLMPSRPTSLGLRARGLVEATVFGWFVAQSLVSEIHAVAYAASMEGGLDRLRINHAAHFAGVGVGAALIYFLRRNKKASAYPLGRSRYDDDGW